MRLLYVSWLPLLVACPSSKLDSGDSGGGGSLVPDDLHACFYDPTCPYILPMAHRGTLTQAPENTLAAFDYALEMGVQGIELDVRTTLDGALVVMHDSEVDRTTDGTGDISEMTLEQVQALSCPSPVDGGASQPVPTFLEVLQHVKGNLIVDVDVKEASAEDLAADIQAAGMQDQVFLLTKSVDKGEAYRAADPSIPIMPNLDSPDELESYIHLEPELAEVDYLDVDDAAAPFATAGVRLFSQTLGFELGPIELDIQEEYWRDMVSDGVQVILTDRPDELVPVVAAINEEIAAGL